MMNHKQLTERAQAEALGFYLSEGADLPYGEVMATLEAGTIPENVVFWEPFETHDPEWIAEQIFVLSSIFISFGLDVLGTTKGRIE